MKQKFAFLFIFSVLLVPGSYSQITKGFWMFGGNGSFEHSKTTYPQGQIKVTNIRVSPNAGYFLVDKFAAGLRVDVLHTKGGSITPPFSKYTTLQVGPYLRYYFLKADKRFNLVSEAGVSYFTNKASDSQVNSFEFNSLAGAVVFLNSSVGLEMLASYKAGKAESIPYNNFGFLIGLQIHLERDRDN
jgi:hypothetical protein